MKTIRNRFTAGAAPALALLVCFEAALHAQVDMTAMTTARMKTALVSKELITVQRANEQTETQAAAKGGVGPDGGFIDLKDALPVADLGRVALASLQDVSNLSLKLYRDGNQSSGIYYYVPSRYFLAWDPDVGYLLTIDYKAEQASGKNVVIDARLTPGELQADLQLLRQLLEVYLSSQPRLPHPLSQISLLPLPAQYAAGFDWSALGVPAADLAITGVDPASRQIGITLTSDVATKEILVKKLGDILGLSGWVTLQPAQAAVAPLGVMAQLQLASKVYANARWLRDVGPVTRFRNRHPFPVELRYLAYLYSDAGKLGIRGYDLGAQMLNPADVAKIPNAQITAEIDGPKALRAWYGYALINDEAYRDRVLKVITGGIGSLPVKKVSVEAVRPVELFAQYHLYKLIVVVRSRHFDPQGKEEIENGYELSPTDARRDLAPLYVPEGTAAPLYEYRVGIVTEDGSSCQDSSWRKPGSGFMDSVFLGARQIEELLAQCATSPQ